MRKLKDKINILVIMQSISRQMFKLYAFGQGKKSVLQKRMKVVTQSFQQNVQLKKQLKLRNLLQSMHAKDGRQKIVQSAISVAKKFDNSKAKKDLVKKLDVSQRYWVKPNKLQQNIGNLLNNSKYYGMQFYRQQQSEVRDVLLQKLKIKSQVIKQEATDVASLCQNFNNKYRQLPQRNKKLIKTFFQGNVIQQKGVIKQISQLKSKLNQSRKQKLRYIVQNTSRLDKFDKVFLLTSVLQEYKG